MDAERQAKIAAGRERLNKYRNKPTAKPKDVTVTTHGSLKASDSQTAAAVGVVPVPTVAAATGGMAPKTAVTGTAVVVARTTGVAAATQPAVPVLAPTPVIPAATGIAPPSRQQQQQEADRLWQQQLQQLQQLHQQQQQESAYRQQQQQQEADRLQKQQQQQQQQQQEAHRLQQLQQQQQQIQQQESIDRQQQQQQQQEAHRLRQLQQQQQELQHQESIDRQQQQQQQHQLQHQLQQRQQHHQQQQHQHQHQQEADRLRQAWLELNEEQAQLETQRTQIAAQRTAAERELRLRRQQLEQVRVTQQDAMQREIQQQTRLATMAAEKRIGDEYQQQLQEQLAKQRAELLQQAAHAPAVSPPTPNTDTALFLVQQQQLALENMQKDLEQSQEAERAARRDLAEAAAQSLQQQERARQDAERAGAEVQKWQGDYAALLERKQQLDMQLQHEKAFLAQKNDLLVLEYDALRQQFADFTEQAKQNSERQEQLLEQANEQLAAKTKLIASSGESHRHQQMQQLAYESLQQEVVQLSSELRAQELRLQSAIEHNEELEAMLAGTASQSALASQELEHKLDEQQDLQASVVKVLSAERDEYKRLMETLEKAAGATNDELTVLKRELEDTRRSAQHWRAEADRLQDEASQEDGKACCMVAVDAATAEQYARFTEVTDAFTTLQMEHEALVSNSTARAEFLRRQTTELTNLRAAMATHMQHNSVQQQQSMDALVAEKAELEAMVARLQLELDRQKQTAAVVLASSISDALQQEMTRSASLREKLRVTEDKLGFAFLKFRFLSERCQVLEKTCKSLLEVAGETRENAETEMDEHVQPFLPVNFDEFMAAFADQLQSPAGVEMNTPGAVMSLLSQRRPASAARLAVNSPQSQPPPALSLADRSAIKNPVTNAVVSAADLPERGVFLAMLRNQQRTGAAGELQQSTAA